VEEFEMFNKNLILDILTQKGWSRYKLCKEAKMAQSTLSDILNGKNSNPRMDTIQKIADALGVSVNAFFDSESTEDTLGKEDKKIEPEKQKQIRTVAAHLEDKDLTPKKLKLLNDYIDALFDDDEW